MTYKDKAPDDPTPLCGAFAQKSPTKKWFFPERHLVTWHSVSQDTLHYITHCSIPHIETFILSRMNMFVIKNELWCCITWHTLHHITRYTTPYTFQGSAGIVDIDMMQIHRSVSYHMRKRSFCDKWICSSFHEWLVILYHMTHTASHHALHNTTQI